jgi:hypothetical protein
MTNNKKPNNNQNQKSDKEYFRALQIFSYDSALTLGCMTSSFGEMTAFIKLARRLKNAPEGKPKAGDKVYDYDNQVFIALGITQAIRLSTALTYILNGGEEYIHTQFKLGIWELEFTKGEFLEKPIANAFVLGITNTDTKESDTFVFENSPINMDRTDGNIDAIIFNQNLTIFSRWLNKMIDEMFIPHKSARGGQASIGQGAKTSAAGARFKRPGQPQTSQESGDNAEAEGYAPTDEDMPF